MIGWKVGFGAPAALERLGLERPLVAPLPASGRIPDGATVSLDTISSCFAVMPDRSAAASSSRPAPIRIG